MFYGAGLIAGWLSGERVSRISNKESRVRESPCPLHRQGNMKRENNEQKLAAGLGP